MRLCAPVSHHGNIQPGRRDAGAPRNAWPEDGSHPDLGGEKGSEVGSRKGAVGRSRAGTFNGSRLAGRPTAPAIRSRTGWREARLPMRTEIVMIGPWGAGKSTLARLIAATLGLPHAPLD